jgi:hypothetical protein
MTNAEIIKDAMSRFPETFGLRAFPGDTFRISESASYLSQWGDPDSLQLYTQRLCEDGKWHDFAKGDEAELRRNVVKLG